MSRFVSAGTNEEPTERDEAWLKAQQEIEAKRQQNTEAERQADGKSLYETLQANKAAKQEAFEESVRLRNQFRSLDEDEVDFLDSVLESTRAKEAEVKKQTSEQLEAFRRQQEEAEKTVNLPEAVDTSDVVETWKAGPRKRKKGRESVVGGVKLRKTSTTSKERSAPVGTKDNTTAAANLEGKDEDEDEESVLPSKRVEAPVEKTPKPSTSPNAQGDKESPKQASPPSVGLGLGAYSSDEDD